MTTTTAPPYALDDVRHDQAAPPVEVSTIRILIADESAVVIDNLARRLSLEEGMTVCGAVGDGQSAVQEAMRLQPDIAIIDAGLPGLDGGQTTEMLAHHVPGTGVIMMSMEAENDAYRRAMLAGAREFLQKPFKGDDLVAAVRRVHAFGQRRTTSAPAPRILRIEPPVKPAPPARTERGTVTCVVSGKGGVGKTVLAANLAVALAADHSQRVVLVDASLQFGDIAAVLDLKTDRTIADLVSDGATVDADLLRDTLVAGPAGTRVLPAPSSPELADFVTTAHLRAIIDALTMDADHVVVDTASTMSDITLTAVDMADHVVLVTDLSVPGVKNARLVHGVFDAVKLDPERVIVVANHREPAGELDRAGAESFLGMQLSLEVAYEARIVPSSVAEGVPFITAHSGSPASEAVRSLARLVNPALRNGSEATASAESGGKKTRSRRRLGLRG